MFWQVECCTEGHCEQKERSCGRDDASEEQKHAHLQIHAACIVLNCARTVMSHSIMVSLSLWVHFDWFQSCLQGFWLVCEHSKWTPNISCPQNQCVSIIISLQLHNWMFLVVTVRKQMSCSYTGMQLVDIQKQRNWSRTIRPKCADFFACHSHVKFYVSIAYLFIYLWDILPNLITLSATNIKVFISALYFLLKSVQQFHQHCEY